MAMTFARPDGKTRMDGNRRIPASQFGEDTNFIKKTASRPVVAVAGPARKVRNGDPSRDAA